MEFYEFLRRKKNPMSKVVEHPDFDYLYMRRRFHYDRVSREDVVTIANITAIHPGNGAFTRLVKQIMLEGYSVCVENVLNPLFEKKLIRDGFKRLKGPDNCYFLERSKDGNDVEAVTRQTKSNPGGVLH